MRTDGNLHLNDNLFLRYRKIPFSFFGNEIYLNPKISIGELYTLYFKDDIKWFIL